MRAASCPICFTALNSQLLVDWLLLIMFHVLALHIQEDILAFTMVQRGFARLIPEVGGVGGGEMWCWLVGQE